MRKSNFPQRCILSLVLILLPLTGCQSVPQAPPPAVYPTIPPTLAPVSTDTATPPATRTPAPSPTPAASPTSTAAPVSAAGWLAILEGGQVTIRDLSGGQVVHLTDAYSQLMGWSPRGRYLLALRPDGASVVLNAAGQVQSVLDGLPQPPFWANMHEAASPEEWLAVPRPDASLELRSFPSGSVKPLYEPGSLGADGLAFVRWGSDGAAILTPSLTQLQNKVSFAKGFFSSLLENGADSQNIAAGGGGFPVSRDFHTSYFEVLDGVPGSQPATILGFLNKAECASCQADGLELVSLDSWYGRTLALGVTLLNTPEAYAWNPAQPGLLALAAGGSRFTLENKQLVLLDVPAGTLRALTGKEQAVYEPSWSPDGRRLAYATLPARQNATGSGQELETLLGGRAIAVYDLTTGAAQTLTHPASDEIDGWPRWSADGHSLLYARKRLADATTQVRLLDLSNGQERLVVSANGAPRACHRVACGWDQMLAYTVGNYAENPPPAPVLAPTATPAILADTPHQGLTTYHNAAYGFSFQYPSGWNVETIDLPNYIKLVSRDGVLMIGYRRSTQQASIQRTGVGSGDFVKSGSIQFLGKTLRRDLLVYGGKVKEVFYQGDCEFSAGNLMFTLGLDNYGARMYEDADIPAGTQKEADQILESFRLDPPQP